MRRPSIRRLEQVDAQRTYGSRTAARVLGVTRDVVDRWAAQKKIRSEREMGRHWIPGSAILRIAKERDRAGLEEIALPTHVAASSRLVLTPATVGVLEGLARLGKGGAPLQVGVIVEDDVQENRVRAGLEEAGGAIALWRIDNLSDSGHTLGEAVVGFQVEAWAEDREVFVVEEFEQLRELGRFLKIPDVSFRSWWEWIQRRLEQAA